ncbi:MAG: helix-turn-helix domain-containing protein [Betaproteobacteria bacterium]|nr:helix-turn-helix domain-containing protein [Betaproteobacteria bacterium]
MNLFGASAPCRVGIGQCAGGIRQELRAQTQVMRFEQRGCIAVVRHVAHHAQGVDPALGQPCSQAGVGESAGRCLVDVVVRMAAGQAQFIQHSLPTSSGAGHRLSTVLDAALASLDQAHSLDALAARAAMGRRTFTRHFRQLTGTTVGRWLLNHRLALAQRLLETTDRSIDTVAADAGLGTAASLRQHFAATFNTSPSAYRRQFGTGNPAGSGS